MDKEKAIAVFENKQIHRHNEEDTEIWYFSLVDIVQALTDSSIPTDYLKKIRKRDEELNTFLGTNYPQIQMLTASGKKNITLAGNETVTNLHGFKMLAAYTKSIHPATSSLLINSTKLLRKLVLSFKFLYLCTRNAFIAFSKSCNSAYFFDSNLTKDNTPSRLTSVAHLGGLLFYHPLAI